MGWHTLFRGPPKWPSPQAEAAEVEMTPGESVNADQFTGMVLRFLAHEFSPYEYRFDYVPRADQKRCREQPRAWAYRNPPLKLWKGEVTVGARPSANPNIIIGVTNFPAASSFWTDGRGQRRRIQQERALALCAWATLRGDIRRHHIAEITQNTQRLILGDEGPYCYSSRQEAPPRIYAPINCQVSPGAVKLEEAGWVDIYLVDGVELKRYLTGNDVAYYTHGVPDNDDD